MLKFEIGGKYNKWLSAASADTVKSVWYSLHVNIPERGFANRRELNKVFVRERKDGSKMLCSGYNQQESVVT